MTATVVARMFSARSPSRFVAAAMLAVAVAFATAAHAQDEDLPTRVGRVASFGGDVFLAPQEDATDWTAIGLNQPITTGDNLWVATDGRAEIDYGGGQLRLAGDTNVHVSRLDERELSLFVAQGRAILRVRVLEAGDVAYVDTPNTQLRLTRPGLYRVDVDPDRETTSLIVRQGEAAIALASGAQQALPGQTVTVAGIGAADADVVNGAGVDGFDTWSAERDRNYERSRSATYVSPQMVGYADLDPYGSWETSSTYGPVWYPTVVADDWAPYRFGRWAWVRGFGYAWVDDAPWGYAPSHYGRWVHVGGRWGWCPGRYVVRPVWSPAFVAWYGGPSWSVSASLGAPVYGWVPLAWGEPFQPWWGRCSHSCWTRYNRPYAVNVAERPRHPRHDYANLRVPGALTAVPGAALAGSRPVAANRVRLQAASPPPVLGAAPPIKPLQVAAPRVQPGLRGAPPPASTMYQAARPRLPAAPAYGAPGSPTARGALQPPRQAAQPPIPPGTPVPRALEPRALEPRPRVPALPSNGARAAPAPPAVVPRAAPAPPAAVPRAAPNLPQAAPAPAVPQTAPPRASQPLPRRTNGVESPRAAPPPAMPQAAPPRAIEPRARALPRQEGVSVAPQAPHRGGGQPPPSAPPRERQSANPRADPPGQQR
jgi:hypothetical protein